MSARLPTPGGDNGDWGDILNAFLSVSLNSDGTIANNVVGTNQLQSNSVTNAQLDVPTQTTLASVSGKYTKPGTGIPATDLATAVQTSLSSANSAVQTVNSTSPTSGNVNITAASINAVPNTTTVNGHALSSNITLSASDVSAIPSSQLGASGGVATLTGTTLTSSQLPSSVVSDSRGTTLGDLLVYGSAGSFTRVGVGSNGQVLTAASAQTDGVQWAAPGNLVVSALGNVTGTVTLDASQASVWTATLTGNATFNFINIPTGKLFQPQIIVTQNSSAAYTSSFADNSVVITPTWDTGVAPSQNATLSSVTIWNMETPDGGTTWYGQGAS